MGNKSGPIHCLLFVDSALTCSHFKSDLEKKLSDPSTLSFILWKSLWFERLPTLEFFHHPHLENFISIYFSFFFFTSQNVYTSGVRFLSLVSGYRITHHAVVLLDDNDTMHTSVWIFFFLFNFFLMHLECLSWVLLPSILFSWVTESAVVPNWQILTKYVL